MEDLRELYQEVILDHSKKPRNFRQIEDTEHHAKGHNPLCGDKVTIFVAVNQSLFMSCPEWATIATCSPSVVPTPVVATWHSAMGPC